jgi:hypothetical protein
MIFSYGDIKFKANAVRNELFAHDEKLAKLQFSNKWVLGFLRRMDMVRRRVTARPSAHRPTVDAVRRDLAKMQAVIANFLGIDIWSLD